ncbi:MAG: hypothetical protein M0006_16970 [Magnetospirillum sp.]|nr:hypothetical protein [Magnetospirillum sp.]
MADPVPAPGDEAIGKTAIAGIMRSGSGTPPTSPGTAPARMAGLTMETAE